MFMSKEQLAILNRFRELTAMSLDLNMKMLADQISNSDAKEIIEKIANEEIDLEERLKKIIDSRNAPKENGNQINFDI